MLRSSTQELHLFPRGLPSCTEGSHRDFLHIDKLRAVELGKLMNGVGYKPMSFDSPDLFPAEESDFAQANYFFFLTAIDHRTHTYDKYTRTKKTYKGFVNGKEYWGSDLMYRLARKAQANEKFLFTAKRLIDISDAEVNEIFSLSTDEGKTYISNPACRAELLRSISDKLLEFYDGDFVNVIRKSNGFLKTQSNSGLLDLLAGFKAYEDPVRKKSYLLTKLLVRQGLIKIHDRENVTVAADHVLVAMAIRTGIICIDDPEVESTILKQEELNEGKTHVLRKATVEAFNTVAREANMEPDIMDDLLWSFGRKILRDFSTKDDLHKIIETSKEIEVRCKETLEQLLSFLCGYGKNSVRNLAHCPEPVLYQDTWYY